MGWFAGLPPRQRRWYFTFIGIIALTIPCYCLGIVALVTAPTTRSATSTTPVVTPTVTPVGATATLPSP